MPRANLWYHELRAMFFVRVCVRELRDPARHSAPVDWFRFADFVVDTGSNLALLSEAFARDLGVDPDTLERGWLAGPLARREIPLLPNVVLAVP